MYDTILVGTDGSDSANRAVEKAILMAEDYGGTLHAISVVNTRRYGEPALSSTELVLTELEERSESQLEEVRDRAQQRDIDVTTHCCHGGPGEAILEYARSIDTDLIVLGYQGQSHPESHMGSTAERVVHNTSRSVLLV